MDCRDLALLRFPLSLQFSFLSLLLSVPAVCKYVPSPTHTYTETNTYVYADIYIHRHLLYLFAYIYINMYYEITDTYKLPTWNAFLLMTWNWHLMLRVTRKPIRRANESISGMYITIIRFESSVSGLWCREFMELRSTKCHRWQIYGPRTFIWTFWSPSYFQRFIRSNGESKK